MGAVPTPVESPNYEVAIRELDRGFVVSVGCKSFAFVHLDDMLHYITLYLQDRQTTERHFHQKTLFT